MPEGHTIHRAARDLVPMLRGQRIAVTSPQGRFTDGARLLDGAICQDVEAIGKHLLYHFDNARSLHIHLGLAGKIYRDPLPADPPRDVVRVRLLSQSHVVDMTGPAICEIVEVPDLSILRQRLGPDLLAEPPEPERAIERVRASRSSIAALLMNQQVISGIGNIYRTEILWLRGIHPLTRGCDLSQDTLQKLWDEMRALMQIGVSYNSIITNGDLPKSGQKTSERVNIYGKENCPACAAKIQRSKLAQRALYHCPNCQRARV